MRKEPYGLGDIVHVIKRGTRQAPFVLEEADRWRYLLMLRHFNDKNWHKNWFRDLVKEDLQTTLKRASIWSEPKPIVKIHAFTLLDNHFHLILEEIVDGGISDYMARISGGISKYFNAKYDTVGTAFESSYLSRTVCHDSYLRTLATYVMVKNTFEMHPDGYKQALENFEDAFEWAISWPYTSLGDYFGTRTSPIVEQEFLSYFLGNKKTFKKEAQDLLIARGDIEEKLETLAID